VQECDVLAAVNTTERRAYEALLKNRQAVREKVVNAVRDLLNTCAEKRSNLYSFWATAESMDEADALQLVPGELKNEYQQLEEDKKSLLLALHMRVSCPDKSSAPAPLPGKMAPSSHRKERCGMKKCKNKCSSAFLQHCKKCNLHFCLPHRLPEVHDCPK
jgi:hypothetical protein